MSPKVPVELDLDVFERLQRLAVPLVDDVGSVIRRVLDEWEDQARPKPREARDPQPAQPPDVPDRDGNTEEEYFRTSRGVLLPLGELRASYRPRGKSRSDFQATVTARGIEFAGRVFDDPSPAGILAKELAGAVGQATATNGWRFWEYFDTRTRAWTPIAELRVR